MDNLHAGLSATPAVLTVEIDLDRVLAGDRPPAPLDREQADQLAEAIADDMLRILGKDIHACGLIVAAAIYDLSELVRPGLPLVDALFELYRGSLEAGIFEPRLMAIGGSAGHFPVPTIAPARHPGAGPLLGIPLLFVGEQDALKRVQELLETDLLAKGKAGFKTDFCLRRLFKVQPENLAYATFNDLSALLKIQLERGGIPALWTLLEGALFRPEETQELRLPTGNHFIQRGNAVYSPFYTFDQWAARPDAGTPAGLDSYFDWLIQQRTLEAGVAAHGMEVHRLAAGAPLAAGCGGELQRLQAEHAIDGDSLTELRSTSGNLTGASVVLMTEQASDKVGLVAYTVLVQNADGDLLHLANEYPLTAAAAAGIRQHWAGVAADLGLDLHLSRPRRVLIAEGDRHLVPDLDLE